ncbi:MAG TPA: LuxR C-terminal-related transcriptional regulator [Bryobacteraceae bacterium]|nr:LuxR C-terminal-related transcriptional regulator [Bryobacteraceae bacterium]
MIQTAQSQYVSRPHIGLTARQTEVLLLIADGKTTKQIAKELGISFKTAAAHRANLMQKLDIHDTANLVRHAIRTGILEP